MSTAGSSVRDSQYCSEGDCGRIAPQFFDPEEARRQLGYMVMMHDHPISIVDHIGFKRFSQALQPLFTVPSKAAVKSDIMNHYTAEKDKLYELLLGNDSRVAIACDMWTTQHQEKTYMAVTAHFIDENWVLQSPMLRFIYVPYPHTEKTLCDLLMEALLEWLIDFKLSTLTVDSFPSSDRVIEQVKEELGGSPLLMNGKLLHMHSFSYILNLIAQDGLDVIRDGIDKIRESVAFWIATAKRRKVFENSVKAMQIPYTRKLIPDCPSKWNSTYSMLETALLYRNAFSRLVHVDNNYKPQLVPTAHHWEFVEKVCSKLKLFYDAAQLFSDTSHPTVNVCFPIICEIKLALRVWSSSDNEVEANMADKMLQKFEKYWDVVNQTMAVAAVLDPQYKMALLKFYFPKLYGTGFAVELDKIHQLCNDLVNEYSSRMGSDQEDTNASSLNTGSRSAIMIEYDRFVMQQYKKRRGHPSQNWIVIWRMVFCQ